MSIQTPEPPASGLEITVDQACPGCRASGSVCAYFAKDEWWYRCDGCGATGVAEPLFAT